jgi:hypothetical protein
MIDKLRSLSMFMFATAALIGAIAALVFVLRSGVARAEPGGGSRYQLTTTLYGKSLVLQILDTYTGHVWQRDSSGDDFESISHQFDPTKK